MSRNRIPAIFVAVAVGLLLFGLACSKDIPTDTPEPVFITYTTADGLASDEVAVLVHDPYYKSMLFAADLYGNLSIYYTIGIPEADLPHWGSKTRPDSIPGKTLLKFGLGGGGGVYLSFLTGDLVRYKHSKWGAISTPFTQASALAAGENESLWATGIDPSGYNGLWHFVDESWELVLNAGRDFYFATITDIVSTDDGSLWLATWGTGLINYNNGSSRLIQTGDGLPSDFISRIRLDDDTGGLWLVTPDGFHLLDGEIVKAPLDNAYLADRLAFDLAVDSKGRHWFATRSNGVLMNSAGTWIEFTEEDGLGSDYVTAITTLYGDEQAEIWVGTRNGVSNYIGE
ncbi:hypothetical protein ACFLT7_01970 [candidate division KSB1 bacterium]